MFILFDLDDTLINHKYAENSALSLIYTYLNLSEICNYKEFYSSWKIISRKQYNMYIEKKISFDEHYFNRFQLLLKNIIEYDYTANDILNLVKVYKHQYLNKIEIFDDVSHCLKSLKSFKKGILTNGNKIEQYSKLKKCSLLHEFEFVICSDECEKGKPHSEMFYKAIEFSRLNTSKLFMIGDNYHNDILPCYKLGINAALLNRNTNNISLDALTFSNLNEFTIFFINNYF